MQGKESIAAKVRPLLQPVAEEMGLILWDVRFVKEGSMWFLRILLDREGAMDVDTCADFSRRVSKLLDEADPIEDAYYLEVSSAGIERDLTEPAHFAWAAGKPVQIKLYAAIDGKKELKGILQHADKGEVTLTTQDGSFTVPIKNTAYIRLWDEKINGGENDE